MSVDKQIVREHPFEVLDIERGDAEGRTLVGRALRYNQQDIVSDDGRNFYVETWLPGVFQRSIELRGDRTPLMGRHNAGRWPFGAVKVWRDTLDDLAFEAKISRTADGDELLELIQDGAVSGISVGAVPITNRSITGGIARVEAKLLELSVCVFPQLAGSEILAVRERQSTTSNPAIITVNEPTVDPVVEGTPRLDEARAYLAGFAEG